MQSKSWDEVSKVSFQEKFSYIYVFSFLAIIKKTTVLLVIQNWALLIAEPYIETKKHERRKQGSKDMALNKDYERCATVA